MARYSPLSLILDKLRHEARLSTNPAHNAQVRATHVNMLQRTQERLWRDFAWPHLTTEWKLPLQNGQRIYDTPANLDIDRIDRIEVFRDGVWAPLSYGVNNSHYASWNSDLDQRSWPPRAWRIVPDEDLEIWPIPNRDAVPATLEGMLRFTGTRKLRPLVANTDTADLDDDMLALYCAAEMLAAGGAKDAQLKLEAANLSYAKQRSGLSPRRSVRMYGIGEPELSRRPFVSSYRPPGS